MEVTSRTLAWLGSAYESLIVGDTPKVPTWEESAELVSWYVEHKPMLYCPVPFDEFCDLPYLRAYPEERWKLCMEREDGPPLDFTGLRVLDAGANTGYYGLLALAAGASEVHLLEPDPLVLGFMEKVLGLHGIGPEVIVVRESLEQYVRYPSGSFDVAFVFSLLHHLAQKDAVFVLRRLLSICHTIFVESGDDHDLLLSALKKSGCRDRALLGTLPVNHGLNTRQVWEVRGNA